MATYIMRELVERNASQYLDHLNFHILPSANPDGYEFTRNGDRFWRKTRSNAGSSSGCQGADGNRNFDIAFGGNIDLHIKKPIIVIDTQSLHTYGSIRSSIASEYRNSE
jgi:murein tripeptide amidase MpaA